MTGITQLSPTSVKLTWTQVRPDLVAQYNIFADIAPGIPDTVYVPPTTPPPPPTPPIPPTPVPPVVVPPTLAATFVPWVSGSPVEDYWTVTLSGDIPRSTHRIVVSDSFSEIAPPPEVDTEYIWHGVSPAVMRVVSPWIEGNLTYPDHHAVGIHLLTAVCYSAGGAILGTYAGTFLTGGGIPGFTTAQYSRWTPAHNMNYLLGIDGSFPTLTHRINFSDTWMSNSINADVTWDGLTKPTYYNLSWMDWVTAHSYGGHPQGSHHVVVTTYDALDVQLAQYEITQNIQSVGTFSFECNFGHGAYPPLELPLGFAGSYYPTQSVFGTYYAPATPWFPPPSFLLFVSPTTYLNTVTMNATSSEPSHVKGWADANNVEIPYYNIGYWLDPVSIDPATTLGTQTLTIHGTDDAWVTHLDFPLTLNIYDNYRWYMSYLTYTNYWTLYPSYPLVDNVCVLTNDILSGGSLTTGSANFTANSVDGWALDNLAQFPTDVTVFPSPLGQVVSQVVLHITPSGSPTPGTYSIDLTVTDNSAVQDTRTVGIELVGVSVSYPVSQLIPGEFHFFVDIATPNNPYCYLLMDPMTAPYTVWTAKQAGSDMVLGMPTQVGLILYPGVTSPAVVSGPGSYEVIMTWDGSITPGDYAHNVIVYPDNGISGVVRIVPVTITVP